MSAKALDIPASESNREPNGKTRRWWAIAGIVAIGLAGAVGWGVQQRTVSVLEPAPAEAPIAEPATVTALGRLEPDGEVIELMAPTSAQETRIQELLVREGSAVQAGQTIAILDNHGSLQASVTSAEEQVRIARARLAQVEAGAKTGELQAQAAEIDRLRSEMSGALATQEATIARLQAEVSNAQLEYDRYNTLYQQGAVAAAERDARQLTLDTTRQQLRAAESELERLRNTSQDRIQSAASTLDQLAEVRPVDIELAEAEVAAAIASAEEARNNLDRAYVKSPQAGQVIEVHTRPGETVGADGIVTIGQTAQMMAIAEVYQSDIQHIQIGQPVTVTSPVLPDSLRGTVERLGLQVQRQQVVDEDPAANIDAKIIEVYVRLDAAASQKVANLTNLQVTVQIDREAR